MLMFFERPSPPLSIIGTTLYQIVAVVGVIEDDVADGIGEDSPFEGHQLIAAVAESWKARIFVESLVLRVTCPLTQAKCNQGYS